MTNEEWVRWYWATPDKEKISLPDLLGRVRAEATQAANEAFAKELLDDAEIGSCASQRLREKIAAIRSMTATEGEKVEIIMDSNFYRTILIEHAKMILQGTGSDDETKAEAIINLILTPPDSASPQPPAHEREMREALRLATDRLLLLMIADLPESDHPTATRYVIARAESVLAHDGGIGK